VKINCAPESVSCLPSSSAPYIGFAVVFVAPIRATPKKSAGYSIVFGL